MRKPVAPPHMAQLPVAGAFPKMMNHRTLTDHKGRYVHWDKLRHLPLPDDLESSEEWWCLIKLARGVAYQALPLRDKYGQPMNVCLPSELQESLHWLDIHAAGQLVGGQGVANPHQRNTYLIRSLVDEAISSSQLEGASTTRNAAKDMIRQGRDPRDKSERMILNNYEAMQFIREVGEEELTPSIVFELHKLVTKDTLDDNSAGDLRTADDDIYVVDEIGEVLHTPPDAEQLASRLQGLCDFANGKRDNGFLHPVVRAIVLHFMLAYDHPFVDGNGRTARALFYWAMRKAGYWLMEFISISGIIQESKVQYGMAFLHCETDENDLTYFIVHQMEVIRKAIDRLHKYLEERQAGLVEAEQMLRYSSNLKGKLNFRQLSILRHALNNPRSIYTIDEHRRSHDISYETSRRDLSHMVKLKLLEQLRQGKTLMFMSPSDLVHRLADSK